MRKLVVCCDGTWNTLQQREAGVPIPTNVARLYFSLDQTDTNQLSYYHPGVGTSPTWWKKLIEGAFGIGIDQNIMSGYRWICDQYQPGDQLYLFGFSRGAYTARSLSGFLGKVGILNLAGLSETQKWRRIKAIYRQKYRQKSTRNFDWPLKVTPEAVKIHFIGVWDTVGALGIPSDLAGFRNRSQQFHDTDLGQFIQTARHALALDEQRASFMPTLWTNYGSRDVKQLWFPGVHSDVGGGYPQTGLSDGALAWMIAEASAAGLRFDARRIAQIKPDFQDVLHDSYTGVLRWFRSQPRTLPNVAVAPDVHASVAERYVAPAITEHDYRQTKTLAIGEILTLHISSTMRWNTTGIFMCTGEQYAMRANGEWLDWKSKFGPAGAADGKFRLVYFLADIFGFIESRYKKCNADLITSRRNFDIPWFALTGVIGDAENPRNNAPIPHHTTFVIGHACAITLEKSGYFYAYANDAWLCYGNNHGSVSLSIERTA